MNNLVHSQADLLASLDSIKNLKILVIGDLILDRYLWGSVERISQEAPVPVLDVGRKEDRLGGAANVARNLSALGLEVDLCGVVGDDLDGGIIRALCTESEISIKGILTDPDRPTSVKTRVMASRQQVVRIDSEKKLRLSGKLEQDLLDVAFGAEFGAEFGAASGAASGAQSGALSSIAGIIVSDYGKGVVSEGLTKKLLEAQTQRTLSLATIPFVLDPHPTNYSLYQAVGVIKPNRKEAELAAQQEINTVDDATLAARKISERWQAELVIITLGEGGMVVYDVAKKTSTQFATLAQDVFDVSGAGDTVTALLSAGLGAKLTPAMACELANIAARVAVSQVGTVAVARERIREEILHIF